MFNWKVSMATNKLAPRHPSPDCTRRKEGWDPFRGGPSRYKAKNKQENIEKFRSIKEIILSSRCVMTSMIPINIILLRLKNTYI